MGHLWRFADLHIEIREEGKKEAEQIYGCLKYDCSLDSSGLNWFCSLPLKFRELGNAEREDLS